MAGARATSSKARRRSDAASPFVRPGVVWHAGWALAIAATAGALSAKGMLPVGPELMALAAAGAAAVIGALAAMLGAPGRVVAVLTWAAAAAAAVHLTGGTAGPLAAWCLAP